MNNKLFVVLAMAAVSGCAKYTQTYPKTVQVHGKVLLDGHPLQEGLIEFHPTSPSGLECTGLVKNGDFAVRTFSNTNNDGAVPGDYQVVVRKLEVGEIGDPQKAKNQPNIPARYARGESSGLTVTVKEGEGDLPPIELKSGGM